jgi:ketosteroid isomerase-like protein
LHNHKVDKLNARAKTQRRKGFSLRLCVFARAFFNSGLKTSYSFFMKNTIITLVAMLGLFSCNNSGNSKAIDSAKQNILSIEKEFSDYVQKEGISAGFNKYAAEDAVANRNGNLIRGREKIHEFYETTRSKKDKLEWTAEFADVATSGDMAYTYGNYVYTAYDSIGKAREFKGVFHTVWKKQKDGTWKFVYD